MNTRLLDLPNHFLFRDQGVAWGKVGQGDPIVCIHGFPWSSQSWRQVVPRLATTNEVYFFDMVGCGLSEKLPGQDVSEPVQSDLLEALFSEWNLRDPIVIGHDFGGLAALRGHFINGLSYKKLILIDAVAVLPSGSPFYAHVRKFEEAFTGLPNYAHEALFRAYIQRAAHKTLSNEVSDIYLTPWQGESGKPGFYAQIAQSTSDAISQVQSRYKDPGFDVHLIWGEHDSFIPVERAHQLRDLLNATSLSIVEEAAHLIQEDAPEVLLHEINRRL